MTEIDPQTTTRAYAFEMWMQAPMPVAQSVMCMYDMATNLTILPNEVIIFCQME